MAGTVFIVYNSGCYLSSGKMVGQFPISRPYVKVNTRIVSEWATTRRRGGNPLREGVSLYDSPNGFSAA